MPIKTPISELKGGILGDCYFTSSEIKLIRRIEFEMQTTWQWYTVRMLLISLKIKPTNRALTNTKRLLFKMMVAYNRVKPNGIEIQHKTEGRYDYFHMIKL